MSRDSSRTHLHLHHASHADLFEEFTRTPLQPDQIYLAPQHQPINPEDEDDVVPDQHAAFGITKATRETREPGWRDLRLQELVNGDNSEATGSGAAQGGGAATRVEGGAGTLGFREGGVTIGPARGPTGVSMAVRQGMRSVGANGGIGSSLRG